MIDFEETQTQFEHYGGELVHYNSTILGIGSANWNETEAKVEELEGRSWREHKMSPVNDLDKLFWFSALSIESILYVFGNFVNGFLTGKKYKNIQAAGKVKFRQAIPC